MHDMRHESGIDPLNPQQKKQMSIFLKMFKVFI